MAIQVELRRMTKADVPRVMEVEKRCFRNPWSESAYLTEISNRSAYYVVACVEGLVVGYAGMWIIADEAHITTLGVDSDYREQKIGEQLLIRLLEEARALRARRATLEVRVSNVPAQNLYRKYGFAPAALRKEYYSDNREDALVMWIDDLLVESFSDNFVLQKQRLADRLKLMSMRKPG